MKIIVILFSLVACAFAYYIVGGDSADQEEVPYQVLLVFLVPFGNICGGSIISDEWVLTAAHCLQYGNIARLRVKYGDVRFDEGMFTKASRKVIHPFYNTQSLDNDVALVKVKQPFTFSDLVLPITLPYEWEELQVGSPALISGWGQTRPDRPFSFWMDKDMNMGGEHAYILQKAFVLTIDTNECREKYFPTPVTDQMICAVYPRGGVDACKGDSGGPLVVGDVQFGITSWGNGCGDPEYPGVYTKVSSIRRFIRLFTGV